MVLIKGIIHDIIKHERGDICEHRDRYGNRTREYSMDIQALSVGV